METIERKPDWRGHFNWLCEKWSDEAVEFAQKRLEHDGVEALHASNKIVVLNGVRDKFASKLLGHEVNRVILVPQFIPIKHGVTSAVLRRIVGEPEEAVEIAGNLLLNEGIQAMQDMTMKATVTSNQVSTNPWSNTNAYTGVGTSNTAEAATQTELQGTADTNNRYYKVMNATYPSRSNQTVSFQSDFLTGEANFVWAEWTIATSATTTVGTTNLNRKVAALGTKASGTWTLTSTITIS